eukprot:TRINITY_DN539_c0_g1_i1.p1 TRINITY_DN539_c0_g1~~TRINITY_DN539_c0_g1_i1.p1  ORF type:complete len:446 (+),score=84.14 TRINITY_DN539_c0_g1_i1:81-1340(+)
MSKHKLDDSEDENAADPDDPRPVCMFGVKCYRKNPVHFKEFQHPWAEKAKKAKTDPAPVVATAVAPAAAAPVVVASDPDPAALVKTVSERSALRAQIEALQKQLQTQAAQPAAAPVHTSALDAYRTIVKLALSDGIVKADEKRMLRGYRKEHNITDDQHLEVLKQLGWTEDEYDDGERKSTEQLLPEESAILAKGGIGLVKIKGGDKKLSQQHEGVFATATAHFYQTMSKTGGNFTVEQVDVVVNSDLNSAYEAAKAKLGSSAKEEWGFHGTGNSATSEIVRVGFKLPGGLPGDTVPGAKLGKIAPGPVKKGAKAPPPVSIAPADQVLSKGVHLSLACDAAVRYSELRKSSQVILCKFLRGKSGKTSDSLLHKVACPDGFASVFSEAANEIVHFNPTMVLPRFVLTYTTKSAHDRQQEY